MATTGMIDLSNTVSVPQAAAVANVHEETIRRWCRSRHLKAQRVGLACSSTCLNSMHCWLVMASKLDITITRFYEPDSGAQVRALLVLLRHSQTLRRNEKAQRLQAAEPKEVTQNVSQS